MALVGGYPTIKTDNPQYKHTKKYSVIFFSLIRVAFLLNLVQNRAASAGIFIVACVACVLSVRCIVLSSLAPLLLRLHVCDVFLLIRSCGEVPFSFAALLPWSVLHFFSPRENFYALD